MFDLYVRFNGDPSIKVQPGPSKHNWFHLIGFGNMWIHNACMRQQTYFCARVYDCKYSTAPTVRQTFSNCEWGWIASSPQICTSQLGREIFQCRRGWKILPREVGKKIQRSWNIVQLWNGVWHFPLEVVRKISKPLPRLDKHPI